MKTWYCYFKSFLYVAVDFKKAKIIIVFSQFFFNTFCTGNKQLKA